MGSKSSGIEDDPVLDEINAMTLARLKKEETTLAQEESRRQSMLATGRMGISSLLSRGFTGFRGHVSGPGNRRFARGEKTVKPASVLRAKQQKKAARKATAARTAVTDKSTNLSPSLLPYTTSMGITRDSAGNIIRDNQG